MNLRQLFEIFVKHLICYLMPTFRRNRPTNVEGFSKQWTKVTIQLIEIENVSIHSQRDKQVIFCNSAFSVKSVSSDMISLLVREEKTELDFF